MNGMALEFSRVVSPIADMEIWNAGSNVVSFVIRYGSSRRPGFHGRTGFVASWPPIDQSRCAIKVGGSPFKTLARPKKLATSCLAT